MKECKDSFGYKIEVGMVLVPTSGEALLLGGGSFPKSILTFQ